MIIYNHKWFQFFYFSFPFRELHNSLLSDPNDGGIKETRYEKNIIISDSTLRKLLPPQLKKYQHNTRSCVVVNVAFMLKVYMHCYYPDELGI